MYVCKSCSSANIDVSIIRSPLENQPYDVLFENLSKFRDHYTKK